MKPVRRVAAFACLSAGCAGGAPLLHTAHVLDPGVVRVASGIDGTFVGGDASQALSDGRVAERSPGALEVRAPIEARAAGAALAFGPGVAPYVGARAGLRGSNEIGLAEAGRVVRFDARHAFESGSVALSVGLGADFAHGTGSEEAAGLDGVRASVQGWGADVPVLVGWRSTADVVALWTGVRAGALRVTGDVRSETTLSGDAALTLLWAGGLAGLAVGFRHIHALFELDVAWGHVTGEVAQLPVHLSGLTVSPSSALAVTF